MTKLYTVINLLLLCGYWFMIAGVTIMIMMKRRAVPSAMAWLLMIYILPLLGIIAYLLFGELNIGKRRAERNKSILRSNATWIKDLKKYNYIFSNENSEVARSLFKFCEHRQGIGSLKSNNVQLLTNTYDTLLTIIHDINSAQKSIELVFYIWQNHGVVNKVVQALISAAKRGVICRLMLDSAGSVDFFRSSYPELMRSSGVNVVEALHVNIFRVFLRRMDLRQHRKIVLIDNYISYIGSMNMVDPLFFKKEAGIGQWIDIMARVEGPIAVAIGIIFSCDWEIETGEHILPPTPNIIPLKKQILGHTIQVIASGPGFPDGVIHQALLISIYSAREKLIITTPYLIPSDDLLYAICTAAQRGVEVHIIVPRYNDSVLVEWASRAFFYELLEAGVLIYQFEGGFLHTKSVLVDNQLSLIGTVNLDMRSLWLNFEITLIIDDNNFGNDLAKVLAIYISNSTLIKKINWSRRPYWQRIIERIFYFFSPLL